MLRTDNSYAARLRELLGVPWTSQPAPGDVNNVKRYVTRLSANQSTLVRLLNAYKYDGEPQD